MNVCQTRKYNGASAKLESDEMKKQNNLVGRQVGKRRDQRGWSQQRRSAGSTRQTQNLPGSPGQPARAANRIAQTSGKRIGWRMLEANVGKSCSHLKFYTLLIAV